MRMVPRMSPDDVVWRLDKTIRELQSLKEKCEACPERLREKYGVGHQECAFCAAEEQGLIIQGDGNYAVGRSPEVSAS